MSKKSAAPTSASFVADKSLSDTDLARLGSVYSMMGKREFGLVFEATKVPVAAMKKLALDFSEYLVESEASQEERDLHKALTAKL